MELSNWAALDWRTGQVPYHPLGRLVEGSLPTQNQRTREGGMESNSSHQGRVHGKAKSKFVLIEEEWE